MVPDSWECEEYLAEEEEEQETAREVAPAPAVQMFDIFDEEEGDEERCDARDAAVQTEVEEPVDSRSPGARAKAGRAAAMFDIFDDEEARCEVAVQTDEEAWRDWAAAALGRPEGGWAEGGTGAAARQRPEACREAGTGGARAGPAPEARKEVRQDAVAALFNYMWKRRDSPDRVKAVLWFYVAACKEVTPFGVIPFAEMAETMRQFDKAYKEEEASRKKQEAEAAAAAAAAAEAAQAEEEASRRRPSDPDSRGDGQEGEAWSSRGRGRRAKVSWSDETPPQEGGGGRRDEERGQGQEGRRRGEEESRGGRGARPARSGNAPRGYAAAAEEASPPGLFDLKSLRVPQQQAQAGGRPARGGRRGGVAERERGGGGREPREAGGREAGGRDGREPRPRSGQEWPSRAEGEPGSGGDRGGRRRLPPLREEEEGEAPRQERLELALCTKASGSHSAPTGQQGAVRQSLVRELAAYIQSVPPQSREAARQALRTASDQGCSVAGTGPLLFEEVEQAIMLSMQQPSQPLQRGGPPRPSQMLALKDAPRGGSSSSRTPADEGLPDGGQWHAVIEAVRQGFTRRPAAPARPREMLALPAPEDSAHGSWGGQDNWRASSWGSSWEGSGWQGGSSWSSGEPQGSSWGSSGGGGGPSSSAWWGAGSWGWRDGAWGNSAWPAQQTSHAAPAEAAWSSQRGAPMLLDAEPPAPRPPSPGLDHPQGWDRGDWGR